MPTEISKSPCVGVLGTNFTMEINQEVAEKLKANSGTHAEYAAYDWFGFAYYVNDTYYMEIWQYRRVVNTISAPTPEQLRDIAINMYGGE